MSTLVIIVSKYRKDSPRSSTTTQFTRTMDKLTRRLRGSFEVISSRTPASSLSKIADGDDRDDVDGNYADDDDDDFDDDTYTDDDAGIINVDKEEAFESCAYHYMTAYLNRAEVKAALHVPESITVIFNIMISSYHP